jgi:signal transduction histidine kinase
MKNAFLQRCISLIGTPFKSMSSRIFSILILGIICSSVLTLWLAFGERQNFISSERSNYRAEKVRNTVQLIYAINALPPENRIGITPIMHRLGIKMVSAMPNTPASSNLYIPNSAFAQALVERLRPNLNVFALPPSFDNCMVRSDKPDPHDHNKKPHELCEALIISLDDGTAIRLSIFPSRSAAPPIQDSTIYFFLLFLSFIAGLAFIVSRMTISPLQQLAKAATDLGQDINRPALPEQGSTEILLATRAFNAMQRRIRDHIQQRTHMLAAITHDLQTPLTRLRLRLEKVKDDELRDKLIEDLSSMQMMVKEGLDLARSMDSKEQLRPLDIDSLLDSICTDAVDAGHNVTLKGKSGATVMARPQTLQRCINNLIDNAIKYGQYAIVNVRSTQTGTQKWLHIAIKDGGPGIPIDQQEQVFEPFFRLENSRSRDTGGTGLGLTIAQNIARQHHGELRLQNVAEGGLEVILSLPIKA